MLIASSACFTVDCCFIVGYEQGILSRGIMFQGDIVQGDGGGGILSRGILSGILESY